MLQWMYQQILERASLRLNKSSRRTQHKAQGDSLALGYSPGDILVHIRLPSHLYNGHHPTLAIQRLPSNVCHPSSSIVMRVRSHGVRRSGARFPTNPEKAAVLAYASGKVENLESPFFVLPVKLLQSKLNLDYDEAGSLSVDTRGNMCAMASLGQAQPPFVESKWMTAHTVCGLGVCEEPSGTSSKLAVAELDMPPHMIAEYFLEESNCVDNNDPLVEDWMKDHDECGCIGCTGSGLLKNCDKIMHYPESEEDDNPSNYVLRDGCLVTGILGVEELRPTLLREVCENVVLIRSIALTFKEWRTSRQREPVDYHRLRPFQDNTPVDEKTLKAGFNEVFSKPVNLLFSESSISDVDSCKALSWTRDSFRVCVDSETEEQIYSEWPTSRPWNFRLSDKLVTIRASITKGRRDNLDHKVFLCELCLPEDPIEANMCCVFHATTLDIDEDGKVTRIPHRNLHTGIGVYIVRLQSIDDIDILWMEDVVERKS
ncbi:hypothetical protein BDK51DRAFT_47581 [Blyttiomyces helicus]|uniref:Uncharacterized protein n=1 Tax=Blyttiomyces helicus TaxID=388810 RepID=A0A4V1IQ98_9FUNG|nr:hypothetical protein BDK51DRAFT_47581 [Blyttiomyces helicus]|eukprot:RKO85807.1 hypothetical protein BDK51DRAFT_47581 [Blyttiomyces helicus]